MIPQKTLGNLLWTWRVAIRQCKTTSRQIKVIPKGRGIQHLNQTRVLWHSSQLLHFSSSFLLLLLKSLLFFTSIIFFLFQIFQFFYLFYITSDEVTSTFLQQLFLFLKTEKFHQHYFFFFFQWILCFHKTLPLSIRKRWFRHGAACTTSFNTLIITIRGQWFETQFMKVSTTITRETQFKTLHFNLIGQFVLLDRGTGGHGYISMGNEKEKWKINMVPTWDNTALRLSRTKTQKRGR